jgi:hypothetical protein
LALVPHATRKGVKHNDERTNRCRFAAAICSYYQMQGAASRVNRDLILETLAKYPRLRASRLYTMARVRGFKGSQDHFRHVISRFRPKPTAEAYQRLRTLPGEQGQVDRGHFGKLTIDNAARPLWAFVMVLSFSRMLFLRFYFGSAMPAFLHGHVSAFAYFGGAGAREPTSSPTVARLLGRIRRSPSRECITATRRRRLSAWRGESTARGRRRS